MKKAICMALCALLCIPLTVTGCNNKNKEEKSIKSVTMQQLFDAQPSSSYDGIIEGILDVSVKSENLDNGLLKKNILHGTAQIDFKDNVFHWDYDYTQSGENGTEYVNAKESYWYTTEATYQYNDNSDTWSKTEDISKATISEQVGEAIENASDIEDYRSFLKQYQSIIDLAQKKINKGDATLTEKKNSYVYQSEIKISKELAELYHYYLNRIENGQLVSDMESLPEQEAVEGSDTDTKKDYGLIYLSLTFDKSTKYLTGVTISFSQSFYKNFENLSFKELTCKLTIDCKEGKTLSVPAEILEESSAEPDPTDQETIAETEAEAVTSSSIIGADIDLSKYPFALYVNSLMYVTEEEIMENGGISKEEDYFGMSGADFAKSFAEVLNYCTPSNFLTTLQEETQEFQKKDLIATIILHESGIISDDLYQSISQEFDLKSLEKEVVETFHSLILYLQSSKY